MLRMTIPAVFALVGVWMICGLSLEAAPPETAKPVVGLSSPPPPPAKKPEGDEVRFSAAPEVADITIPAGRRALSVKDRHTLGVTPANLIAIGRALREAGEIDKDTPPSECAAAIAVKLKQRNPGVYKTVAGPDVPGFVQALLDLVERQMPLLWEEFWAGT